MLRKIVKKIFWHYQEKENWKMKMNEPIAIQKLTKEEVQQILLERKQKKDIMDRDSKESIGMEKFSIRLKNVADAYDGFIAAVLTYVNNKKSRIPIVEKFMDDNPNALSSDILEFISKQDDFYEDAAYEDKSCGKELNQK